MYVVCVTVWVKAGHEQDFIEATLDNAQNTRQEPANLRFDVSQSADEPTRFMIYEVYQTPEGFKAHQQTEHYIRWRDKVCPLDGSAAPRDQAQGDLSAERGGVEGRVLRKTETRISKFETNSKHKAAKHKAGKHRPKTQRILVCILWNSDIRHCFGFRFWRIETLRWEGQ